MPGLTENGFEIKRLPEIVADIETELKSKFPEINTLPDSVFGQIIGIISKPISDIWEVMEAVYLSEYPASAEGFSLDNAVQYTGVLRLAPTPTRVEAVLKGTEGTVVPKDTQASVDVTKEIFKQLEDVTITKLSVLKVMVEVVDLVPAFSYVVNLAGFGITVLADSDPTKDEITYDFVNAINSEAILEDLVVAVDNFDGTFTVTAKDLKTAFGTLFSAHLSLKEIWTPTEYEAVLTGPIAAVAGTLINIETPVSGLAAISNLTDGAIGRDLETDDALRVRRRASLRVLGAGTVEAIKSRIMQEVNSVLAVLIVENRTLVTDGGGRPGKSFETVVVGGTDEDIAAKLWELKPAGIETFGTTSVYVEDSTGTLQLVKFSRPTNKYGWVWVRYSKNSEETFPPNGEDLIRAAVLVYGNTFEIGQNMIIQKFYTPIYIVAGLDTVILKIAKTNSPLDTPSYGTSNISIAANEIALFASDRIIIEEI